MTDMVTNELLNLAETRKFLFFGGKAIEAVNSLFQEEVTASTLNRGFFEEHPDRKTFLIPGENISAG